MNTEGMREGSVVGREPDSDRRAASSAHPEQSD